MFPHFWTRDLFLTKSLSYQDSSKNKNIIQNYDPLLIPITNVNTAELSNHSETILPIIDWAKFRDFLKRSYSKNSIRSRILYARQYYHILTTGNAQELLTLSNDKRLQVMKSLAILAKFSGCYDKWQAIKEKYQLKWSNGENGIEVFQNIVNNKTNYNSMLKWLRETCSQIDKKYANILIYCTLTGLRAEEAYNSIKLIHSNIDNYLNKKTMVLEHFRYPNIFIRRTKQAFISIANDNILNLARDSNEYSYNALRCYLKRKDIPMNMNYCRKIYATFLRENEIQQETIDILQGRISKSIFVKHYYRPEFFVDINNKIQNLLNKLLTDIQLNQ